MHRCALVLWSLTWATAAAADPPKPPQGGDFDAGGQVRLPSGPDDMGKFATFNWIAVDLKGRYYLLDWLTVDALAPVAAKHPDLLMTGESPKMFGGVAARLEAKMKAPDMPLLPHYDMEIGVAATLAYMHQGAMLLSPSDYPLFVGDYKPGVALGLTTKLKLSDVVDFHFNPQWVDQSEQAVQIPLSLVVKLGSLVQTSADLGIYTGPDYSFSGSDGGRIATGASLTVKLGPIVTHLGAGFASLLTGGLYPTIRDSVYLDVNVKYAK